MSNKYMKDRCPLGTFLRIAIFITAFSIQGGSQSYAYNLTYISHTQLVLEHSGYMTFTTSSLFLLVLFFSKAALVIATHGQSACLHSHTGFASELYLTWKQPRILLQSFQLACLLWLEESLFFQTPSRFLKYLHTFHLVPVTTQKGLITTTAFAERQSDGKASGQELKLHGYVRQDFPQQFQVLLKRPESFSST